jgi:large subunit ribosomal protein L10
MVVSKEDPVAVAKALQVFTRTNQQLTIKAGFVDGQVLAPDDLKALADLPSKEVLRAHLVGAIQGPLAQLVGLITAPQRDLVYILEQRGKQEAPGE